MKEVLFETTSTNGRTTLSLVGNANQKHSENIFKGGVIRLAGGTNKDYKNVYSMTEDEGQWVYVGDDYEVISGGVVLQAVNMQSGRTASIALISDEAILQFHGYKGRGSSYKAFCFGEFIDVPEALLYEMGLIDGVKETFAPPPKLDGAFASAFAKLRK